MANGDANYWQQRAAFYAKQSGVPTGLFTRQIKMESGFRPTARSSAGAVGIAQIMPNIWGKQVNANDPEASLKWAAQHDASVYKKYGNWQDVLSVYNSGRPWSQGQKIGQTNRYVTGILGGLQEKRGLETKAPAPASPMASTQYGGSALKNLDVNYLLQQSMDLLNGKTDTGGLLGWANTRAALSGATVQPQGLSSTSGKMPAGTVTGFAGRGSPYPQGAPLGRVDQGLDYAKAFKGPVYAVGDGTVTKVNLKSWGGGGVVEYRLDNPLTVNGHTYTHVYTAEAGQYPVRPGQRIKAGQPIAFTKSGWQESGFASPTGGPLAPLVGGLGAGTKPTRPGSDFLTYVKSLKGP